MTRVVRRSSKKYRWLSQGQDALLSRLAAARPQTNSIAPVFQPIQSGITQRVRLCTAPSVVPSTRIGFSQRLAHARVLNRNTSAIVSSSLSSPLAPSTPSPPALHHRSLEAAFPPASADIATETCNRARRGHSTTYPMTPPTNHTLYSGVFTSSAPIAPVRLRMCLPPPFPSCRPHELLSTAIPKATVPSLPRRSPSSRHHPHHEHCLGAVPMCA